jgi:5-methylcytosine-specific restriction endonuclease McrA
MTPTNYQQKLRLPQWQKRRLHVLERADWRCAICGSKDQELHVHHLEYNNGKEPWDYPDTNFLVVCRPCHEERIHKENALYRDLPSVHGYRVIRFEHIDDSRCFQPLRRFCEDIPLFEEPSEQFVEMMVTEMRRRLTDLFKNHGWEGDGDIKCIFVRPVSFPPVIRPAKPYSTSSSGIMAHRSSLYRRDFSSV